MEIRDKFYHSDGSAGHVVETHRYIPSVEEVRQENISRASQIVWYIVSLIEALLALRLIFSLFNAREIGFTDFLYSLTNPLLAPFRGIFPAPGTDIGFFDTATLLAMLMVALIGWALSSLITLLTNQHAEGA